MEEENVDKAKNQEEQDWLLKKITEEEDRMKRDAANALGISQIESQIESTKRKGLTLEEQNNERKEELHKKYQEELKMVGDDLKKQEFLRDKYNKGRGLFDDLLKAEQKNKREEDTKNRISKLKSDLGVDSTLEKMKSPYQRLMERLGKISELAKLDGLSKADVNSLRSDAFAKYNKEFSDKQKDMVKEQGIEKYKSPEALMAGSTGLYSAWTNNQQNWQGRIVAQTQALNRNTLDCKRALDSIHDMLRAMQEQPSAVWG